MGKVRLGPGSVAEPATEVDRFGAKRVLLITSDTLADKTDLVERVGAVLDDRLAGVFSKTHQHVPRATAAAREAEADCLVSFGGSSPSDTTKLVALLLAVGVEDAAGMDALHFREVHGQIEVPTVLRGRHRPVASEVAAADAGAPDPEDRVGRLDEGGVRNVLDPDVSGSVHDSCSHRASALGFFDPGR
ncbi:MAG: iron-containing alcohol dehydrogenase [Actinobacteria bacterium]|nr:iron-containing alcohol dehydrogenase [Actinomycetota bacterium]